MLSIIIPTFNEQNYLPLVLAEIMKQDFADYEIIVADADSTDDTVQIAKRSGCKVVRGGMPGRGRNEGAKVAKGDLLLFMDADIVFMPRGFLKNLVKRFRQRNLDVATVRIYPRGNFFDKIAYALYYVITKLTENFLPHAANVILVKRNVHETMHGFDESVVFAEDHEYVRRALKHGRFGLINTSPLLTSPRRFEKDGRILTYSKYFLCGFLMLFTGGIRSDIFRYRFGYPLKNLKERIKSIHIKNIGKLNHNNVNAVFTMYKLPKVKFPEIKFPELKSGSKLLKSPKSSPRQGVAGFLVLVIVLSSIFGFLAGTISGSYFYWEIKDFFSRLNIEIATPSGGKQGNLFTFEEQAIVSAVKNASPAVVSIVITKDLPVYEEYYASPFGQFFFDPFFQIPQRRQIGTEKREVGGGTGFIVTKDGMIVTNKHVILDSEADYTVVTADGWQFPAQVLAQDPLQDIAVLKIEQEKTMGSDGNVDVKSFPTIKLGDSDSIQIGQTAIAIGYVLGKYQNTVSVGIISGLGRTIEASSGNFVEILEDIIQTDTAINKGNSGGPLLNSRGEVVGINTAIDLEGQSVGFAVPINKAKRDVEQVKAIGEIIYPFLGVRYALVTKQIQKDKGFSVDYGAWITKNSNGDSAIFSGSPAEQIGLKEGDIILEFDNEKITINNTLEDMIMKYFPGDEVKLKVLVDGEEKTFMAVLAERE